jgi:predicted phage tail protein
MSALEKEVQELIVTEGAKKGGGGGGQESPDTLLTNETVKLLHLIGEGELSLATGDAKSIFLNSTPLQNSDDSYNFGTPVWEWRSGAPSQALLTNPAFPATTQIFTVNQEILGGSASPPVSPAPVIYSVTADVVDYATVTISFPNGFEQVDGDGNIVGDEIQLAFDVKPRASSTWVNQFTRTIKGKASSSARMQFSVNNPDPGELWDIRVRRLTADNETTTRKNASYVFAVQEAQKVQLTYDGVAILGLQLNAATIGGENASIPVMSFLVRPGAIPIPSNYDPDTHEYDGVWDGTFTTGVTDNPAWVLYNLLTNERYGMYLYGIREEDIDVNSFYDAGVFNDEMVDDGQGGSEPRFTFNAVLQNRQESLVSLQQVAGSMNSSLTIVNGLITLDQDRPRLPQYAITKSNAIASDPDNPVYFTYTGNQKQQRNSVIHVTYTDKTDPRYLPKIVSVQDDDLIARYGYQPDDIIAFGATTPGQALRAGRYWMYQHGYNNEQVVFKQGPEGFNKRLSDVFELFDDNYAGTAVGGRVVAATSTSVTLDQPVTIDEDVTTTVSIFQQDGITYETHEVANGPGTYTTLSIVDTFGIVPEKYATYGVTSSIQPRLFKIADIKIDGLTKEVTITADLYSDHNYEYVEGDYEIPEEVYTRPQNGPPLAPQNVTARGTQFIDPNDSLLVRGILVQWDRPESQNISYVIKWRKDNGNYQTGSPSVANSFELPNVVAGVYDFLVFSVNIAGQYSNAATVSYTLSTAGGGASATLTEITDLQVVGGGTVWTGTDLAFEWVNPSANQGLLKDFLVTVAESDGSPILREIVVPPVAGGQAQKYVYHFADNLSDGLRRALEVTVQGRDSNNDLTPGITEVLTNTAPAAPDNITAVAVQEAAIVSWDPATDPDVTGYIVWHSTSNGFTPSAANALDVGLTSVAQLADLDKSTTYYYRVAAYDIFGKSLDGTGLDVSSQLSFTVPSNVGIPSGSSLPGSGTTGDFFFETTTGKLYQYNGGAWAAVGIPSGSSLPGSANEGDVFYNTTNNILYTYNGSTWNPVGVPSGSSLPGSANEGDVFYNTTNNTLYAYDGSAWKPVGMQSGSSLPGSAAEGDTFYNTTNNTLYAYDGSTWKPVGMQSGSSNPGTAAEGDTFFNTTDNLLYAHDGSAWNPVGIRSVSSLPGSGTTGQVVYLTTDSKLYRWNGSSWIKAVDGADITADTITGNKIVAGEITGSHIDSATITASNIASGTITTTQIAAGTIKASNIEAGTITGSLIAGTTITGSNLVVGTITGTQIAGTTITASHIASGTITGTQIAGTTITASNIAAGTITTSQIASLTITGGNIAATTITGGKLVAGTITANEIAATTITGGKLVAGTITGTQIAGTTITGSHIAASTITADKLSVSTLSAIVADLGTITGGTITLSSTGHIKIGSASAFMSGTGIWEGMDSGTAKWRVGNPSGQYASWDGTTFSVVGNVAFPIVSNDSAGAELGRNDTNVTGGVGDISGVPEWETLHTFTVAGTGTFAVRIRAKVNYALSNQLGFGGVRVVKNGVTEVGAQQYSVYGTYDEFAWTGIASNGSGDTFTIQAAGTQSHVNVAGEDFYSWDEIEIDWSSIRANLGLVAYS